MSVLTRMTRLFKADVHGILDAIEDPRTIVKQSIREMQGEIAKSEQALEVLRSAQERAKRQREAHASGLSEVEQQVILCAQAGNPALTKSIIRKKLEMQRRGDFLQREGEKLAKENLQVTETLTKRREQLREIQEKFELFSEDVANSTESTSAFEDGLRVSDEEVEVAFLKVISEQSPQPTTKAK